MTWIIVGGNGQLGTALNRELSRSSIEKISLSREEIDITEAGQTERIASLNPSVIVNCAAWTDVDGAESHPSECKEINIDGALNLAKVSKTLKIPFVQISTDYVFSGFRDTPWTTHDVVNPSSVYGASKAEAEGLIQKLYPEGSYIIRTAWLYSPWRKNFAKTILKRAIQDLPCKVVNDQYGQPTSAIHLARKIIDLFKERIPQGTYHGTNSGVTTWFEFAKEIYRLAGKNPIHVTPVSSEEFPTVAQRPRYSVLSHDMWVSNGVEEMDDWRIALESVFPEIMQVTERELADA